MFKNFKMKLKRMNSNSFHLAKSVNYIEIRQKYIHNWFVNWETSKNEQKQFELHLKYNKRISHFVFLY